MGKKNMTSVVSLQVEGKKGECLKNNNKKITKAWEKNNKIMVFKRHKKLHPKTRYHKKLQKSSRIQNQLTKISSLSLHQQ
jgi:hypothetical protein